MSLSEEQNAYWQSYLANSRFKDMPGLVVSAFQPGDARNCDELLDLYLAGKKTAGSGLVKDYEKAGDRLPQVGDFSILLDSQQKPRAILRTIKVIIQSFDCVNDEVAEAEGEGDRTLAYWQKAHREFFAPYLKGLGITDLEPAEVITEFYEVIKVP